MLNFHNKNSCNLINEALNQNVHFIRFLEPFHYAVVSSSRRLMVPAAADSPADLLAMACNTGIVRQQQYPEIWK